MISECVSLQRLNTIVCRGVMNNRIIKLFLNYHIPVYVEIHNREPSISNRKYWQTYLDLLYSGYYRNSSNVAL